MNQMEIKKAIEQLKDLRKDREAFADFHEPDDPFVSDIAAIDTAISVMEAECWVPCSERMPDPHEKLLFFTFGKSVWCGKYCGIRNGRKTWETSKFVSTFWDDEVTHWMPVPDAPAKEKPPQNAGR